MVKVKELPKTIHPKTTLLVCLTGLWNLHLLQNVSCWLKLDWYPVSLSDWTFTPSYWGLIVSFLSLLFVSQLWTSLKTHKHYRNTNICTSLPQLHPWVPRDGTGSCVALHTAFMRSPGVAAVVEAEEVIVSSLKMRQTYPSEAETKALRTWVWWRWRTNKSHEPLEWMSHWCLKRIKPCGNVFYMLPVRESLERKLLPIFYSCSCGDYIQNPVPDWQKSHGAPRNYANES